MDISARETLEEPASQKELRVPCILGLGMVPGRAPEQVGSNTPAWTSSCRPVSKAAKDYDPAED